MEEILLREKLHELVESCDGKLLQLMYALANEYNNEPNNLMEDNPEFTNAELQEFARRREAILKGTEKTYSWEEVKHTILTGYNGL